MMLPSGTITFLFTDIEGSTRMWEEHPQAMNQALAQHDALLHDAVQNGQGQLIKTTGDGLHAVFESAVDALEAVLSAQQALVSYAWPEELSLRVRMALYAGEADLREGDYYGPDVNRAARLMSLAHGGQILISASTAALVRHQLPDRVSLVDLGSYRLRSLAQSQHVFQLVHPDLPADFPPLVSQGQIPNNLPEQLTSFIGRKREMAAVQQFLAPADQGGRVLPPVQPRLVTLIGPGGTGKTRLSLRVGKELLESFPDGVWLAELAPLTDPQFILPTIASLFGLSDQPGRPLLDRLTEYLSRRQVLLILDNCEHLIDDCADLADHLLRACPKLRILASSREALGIVGEQAYRVRSLSLPPTFDGLSLAELSAYEAVNLFVQRAAAVKPNFTLTQDNATSILQICQQLDGIPLALELAAARLRVLAAQQIAERLDNRFRLLTGGSRTALPRQRTLAALIDWSYDLLSEREQILLYRLSVFSGGWTLEAAEAIAAFEPLDPYEVLDLLDQLVSKSLAGAEETDWGMRYQFLETIRQYAQEKLAESGEADAVRRRHLDYFVDQSREATSDLLNLRGGDWITRLAIEAGNLRAARSWAADHDLAAALQFSTPAPAWHKIIPDAEALRYLRQILARAELDLAFNGPQAPAANRRILGAALGNAGGVAFRLGLNSLALEYEQRSVEIADEVGDLGLMGWVRGNTAAVSGVMGDVKTARAWHEEADDLVEQSTPWARAMNLIAWIMVSPEDEEEAWRRWEDGMVMLGQGNELWGLGMGYQLAAFANLKADNEEEARRYAQQSLLTYEENDDIFFANIPRSILADLDRRHGEYGRAAEMYQEIALVWRDKGNIGAVARSLECLAFIARAQVEVSELPISRLAYAVTLLGAAAALRRSHNSPMTAVEEPEYEAELTAIQAALDGENFQSAWRRGQRMNLDQALAFALGDSNS